MGLSAPAPLGRRRRRGGAFRVPQLFANNEAGAWYDPSDLTAEKVAWRRNLWLYSEPTSATGYTVNNVTFTTNALFNFLPGGGACIELADATVARNARQNYSLTAGVTYTLSFYVTIAGGGLPNSGSGSYRDFSITRDNQDVTNYALITYDDLGGGVYRARHTWLHTATGTAIQIGKYSGLNTNTAVRFTGIQLDVGPTATAYQRITDFTSDFLAAFPTHALYQDSAGTTPVTALGQPVGLALDTSRGSAGTNGSRRLNLLTFSEQFDNAAWTKLGATVTANAATAPDGATTADKLIPTAALTNLHGAFSSAATTVSGVSYQASAYVKAAEYGFAMVNCNVRAVTGPTAICVDLATGSVSNIGANVTSHTVTAVGNGWYRVTVTATSDRGTGYAEVYALNAAGSFPTFAGDGTSGILVWGADIRLAADAAVAPTYQRVTDTWYNAVPGVHAIQPTSASRPLLDGRVNLLTFSEQYSDASWTKTGGAITANTTVAPDGTTTGDTFTAAAGTSVVTVIPASITVATTAYAQSIYARAGTYRYLWLGDRGDSIVRSATFDLQTGTILGSFNVTSATVTNAGNGWYKCDILYTRATAGPASHVVALGEATPAVDRPSRTWAGTESVVLWGSDFRLAADAAYPYQRVAAATDYADVGVPRSFLFDGFDDSLYTASNMDFATVTSDGLARRNLLLNPTQFDVTASWTLANPGTLTANTDVAPDGTTTASTVTDNITGNFTAIRQTVTVANNSQQYAGSAFLKKTTGATTFPGLVLLFSGGTGKSAAFALNTNTGIATARTGEVPDTIAVTDAGAYWRAQWTVTNNASGNTSLRIEILPAVNTDAGATWSATTTGSTVAWGAQLELGSTATAFQNIGTDKVTVLAGVRKSASGTGQLLELSAAVSANGGSFSMPSDSGTGNWGTASNATSFVALAESATNSYVAPVTTVNTGLHNLAVTTDKATLRINGVQVATASSSGTGNFGSYVLFIGRRNNASLPFNGKAYQLIVRGALTDAATLTQAERFVAAKTGVTIP